MSSRPRKIAAALLVGATVMGLAKLPWNQASVAQIQWPIAARAAPLHLPVDPDDWRGDIDYPALDVRIRAMMGDKAMHGLAIAVVEKGRLSFVQGYGLTSKEAGEKIRPDTVFRWASLSKTVAGTLTAQLAADKVFSLTDPLGKFHTSLRLPGDAQNRLTIEQLLSQRTGLHKNAYDDRLEEGRDPRAIRESYASLSNVCAPATCHSYQNIAYDTISEVIGRTTREPYADVVRKRLFLPLGMAGASIGMDGLLTAQHWARPHRYGRTLPVLENYYRVPAAAGVNSSIVDLALWMQAQMGKEPAILPVKVLEQVQRPRVGTPKPYGNTPIGRQLKEPGYGLGMRSFTYQGHRLVGHSGAVSGYRSTMIFDPKTRTGIAMLWNSEASLPFKLQFEFFDRAYKLPFTDWMGLKGGLVTSPKESKASRVTN